MKATVYVVSSSLMTMLTVAIIVTITMKSSYMELVRNSLDEAVEYSIHLLQTDMYEESVYGAGTLTEEKRTIHWQNAWNDSEKNEEFKQDFCSYLAANVDSRVRSLDVNIYGADVLNGLLSVEVFATFQYPSGSYDTVSTYKTIILNKTVRQ